MLRSECQPRSSVIEGVDGFHALCPSTGRAARWVALGQASAEGARTRSRSSPSQPHSPHSAPASPSH